MTDARVVPGPTDGSYPERANYIEPVALSQYNELGKTGLKHHSGTLYEEWLPQLQGQRAYRTYTEMAENDPVIGGSLFAIESLLRSVEWVVEPATADPYHMYMAEFVQSCMDDMSHTWEDFISEILTMLRHGWSYFEVVYKLRGGDQLAPDVRSRYMDGMVGWRKFAPRSQDTLYRWRLSRDGGVRGLWQFPPPTGESDYDDEFRVISTPSDEGWSLVYLPIEKCLLFRTTSHKNSPQGRSLLRNAYRPWYFCKRIEEIESIGVERDLAGLPFAQVPIEILAQERTPEAQATFQYIKDVVTRTKRDEQEGIIFPNVYDENGNKLYEFSLLSTGSRRQMDTGAIITRYNQEKAMSLLADWILLGHENVGSFALSSDKTEMFAVALGSILDAIEDVLNDHAIPRLLALNGMPTDDNMPQFRHGDVEKPDLQVVVQYIQGLANAGAPLFPDLVLENHLRRLAGLPQISQEERDAMMAQQMAEQQAMMGGEEQGGPSMGMPGKPGGMVGFPGAKGSATPSSKPPGQGTSSSSAGGRPESLSSSTKP